MNTSVQALREEKLLLLAEEYGTTPDDLLKQFGNDSVVPGICMNPECDYTTEYEPDQREGFCEVCGTRTVASLLVLLQVI